MQMSPGCNCCCVDLIVNDDNTDKWEKDDYTTPGEVWVTVLEPVTLCNFAFGFQAVLNSSTVSGDGTMYLYLLDDPNDDEVDAIGTIQMTSNYDKDGLLNKPFFAEAETENFIYGFPFADGTGEVDIPDLGITTESFNHSHTLAGFSVATFGDKFVFCPSYALTGYRFSRPVGLWNGTGTTIATLDNLGGYLVFDRDACTDANQKVYLRYKVDGDGSIPNVRFNLETINNIGDRSCRTETGYYDAGEETGSCISPPTLFTGFPGERQPFFQLAAYVPDQWNTASSTDLDKTFWIVGGGLDGDVSIFQNPWISDDLDDSPFFPEHELDVTAEMTCDAGYNLLTVTISYTGSSSRGPWTWEVELDHDVVTPSDIPNTELNENNRTDSNTYITDATFTINP